MDFHLPDLGEGIYEVELIQWLVQPGDNVSHGQALMDVMTDKAVVSIAAPFEGVVQQLLIETGAPMKVGDTVLTYAPAHDVGQPAPDETRAAGGTVSQRPVDDGVIPSAAGTPPRSRAAPSVRRRARALGIDLAAVHGSGPAGRVLMKDVESSHAAAAPALSARIATSLSDLAPGSRVKLHGLRRTIADVMSRAKRTIPHYSLIDECDATALVQLRDSLKETCARSAVKLTYLAFIVQAAVEALKEVPPVNASMDEQAEEIVLHDHYHIGIATATPQGLVVPVIHDADQKGLLEIAREIERLSGEARRGEARLEDLRGGTFTITSLGSAGGLISTPIIHPPEVAILGVGRIVRRPVYDEHAHLRPADLLYLSFSFDHRVVDGDVAARFAGALIRRLQSPATLLV
jgi:pyruvate/2-oxoglutarate dehydrogenase complex dihydrolipoamide acyltransferase (E2) component